MAGDRWSAGSVAAWEGRLRAVRVEQGAFHQIAVQLLEDAQLGRVLDVSGGCVFLGGVLIRIILVTRSWW